ncbi:MAG TPA: hypothetical protein VHG91_00605 [Longimicrobium sp.]|nr:hypothetical protein [Longimicrobium sp.]
MPRPREHIAANLESLYREAYARASEAGDTAEMARLDFAFRRDQLYLESILDVRDLLHAPRAGAEPPATEKEKSVLEQINDLRTLTRLPFGR